MQFTIALAAEELELPSKKLWIFFCFLNRLWSTYDKRSIFSGFFPWAYYSSVKRQPVSSAEESHTITEHSQLEGIHKDQVQLLSAWPIGGWIHNFGIIV